MTPDLLDLAAQMMLPAAAQTLPDVRASAAPETHPDVESYARLLIDDLQSADAETWTVLTRTTGTHTRVLWPGTGTVEQTVRRIHQAPLMPRSSVTGAVLRNLLPRPELPRHYLAFRDLVDWLSATNDEVSAMLGVGPTTHYHWKNPERTPRTTNIRAVLQHHNVLGTLRERLGSGAFERWLTEGGPSRRDTILAGGLDAMRPEIYDVVFSEVTPNPMVAEPAPPREPIDRAEGDLGDWAPDGTAVDELD